MSQCVPSWNLGDNHTLAKLSVRPHSYNSTAPDVPMLDDYEVAELTWENGQLAMHGLGPPRVAPKSMASTSPSSKYTWEKPRTCGTLESIVNQATRLPHHKPTQHVNVAVADDVVPWFDQHGESTAAPGRGCSASATMTMDALVPCSNRTDQDLNTHVMVDSVTGLGGTGVVGCSTGVGSCSGPSATQDEGVLLKAEKRAMVARVAVAPEWSSRDQSGSHSATFGPDSQRVTRDTCEINLGVGGFTSTTSFGSQENTSSGKPCTMAAAVLDENDSVCHSKTQREAGDEEDKRKGTGRSSISTKRSRAAAMHNQSERKRRDKINQRMKTLQKLVPNSSKTDKASMLDEVIDYLKQLQAQVQMMSRMNMLPMMLPMNMQQQLQMSLMAPMSLGLGMGMGVGVMDMNSIGRSNISGMPSLLQPTAFMPIASWDGSGDRLPPASTAAMPDHLSAFLACQSQPMTMEAYSRMTALQQQLHQQPPASNSKS